MKITNKRRGKSPLKKNKMRINHGDPFFLALPSTFLNLSIRTNPNGQQQTFCSTHKTDTSRTLRIARIPFFFVLLRFSIIQMEIFFLRGGKYHCQNDDEENGVGEDETQIEKLNFYPFDSFSSASFKAHLAFGQSSKML